MNKKMVLIFILPLLVLIFRPFNMDLNQAIVFSSLILTIITWIIDKPNKVISSIFLLVIFIIFGNTLVKEVLFFPLSSNFLLIILSFVFSQGIINSNLGEKVFLPFISQFGKTVYQFLFTMVITVIILVFIIPLPFSRAILLSTIYLEYFDSINLEKSTREVLMFGMFATNVIVHVFFKRGDLILNNGILAVANVQMSEFEWIKNLFVPGMGLLLLALGTFIVIFHKELKLYKPGKISVKKIELNKEDKINLILIIIVIFLWATESIHNINGTIVVILGTMAMYLRRMIDFRDFKSINFEILIFLTAAFSIGSVMAGSGIADKIFGEFTRFIPKIFSFRFVLIVVFATMSLHMVLGSSATTMSVAIPSFISLVGGRVDPKIIMLLVFASIVTHYLLPFHNGLLILGAGNNYFSNKTVFRFGIVTTIITPLAIFLFFIPWWKFVGLI